MAYQILSFATSPFTQQRTYTILCDTTADLPATVDGYSVTQGFTAKIIEDGSTYIADSSGTWKKQPDGIQLDLTGYYTAAQTDSLLAGKQDSLSASQLDAVNSGITAAKLTALENSVLKIVDKEYLFSDYTFVQGYGTGIYDGIFYIPSANLPTITGITQIWSVSIADWTGLMPSEVVTPYISGGGSKVGFLSNVGTFTTPSSKMTIRIIGK